MTDGKNLPLVNELYLEATGKEGLKKDGTAKKELIDYMKENFKPNKNTVIKYFSQCAVDIDKGIKDAETCYTESTDKTFEQGSIYINPAIRMKRKQKKLEEKYPPVKF